MDVDVHMCSRVSAELPKVRETNFDNQNLVLKIVIEPRQEVK